MSRTPTSLPCIHERVQRAISALHLRPEMSPLALSVAYHIPTATAFRIKREFDGLQKAKAKALEG